MAVGAKLLDRVAVGRHGCLQKGAQLLVAGDYHSAEQRVLVGEVQVQRVGAHARAGGDGPHGQFVLVAELEQQLARRVHQRGA